MKCGELVTNFGPTLERAYLRYMLSVQRSPASGFPLRVGCESSSQSSVWCHPPSSENFLVKLHLPVPSRGTFPAARGVGSSVDVRSRAGWPALVGTLYPVPVGAGCLQGPVGSSLSIGLLPVSRIILLRGFGRNMGILSFNLIGELSDALLGGCRGCLCGGVSPGSVGVGVETRSGGSCWLGEVGLALELNFCWDSSVLVPECVSAQSIA